MNKTLPIVQESESELKQHLRREQGARKQRVQALYRLVSRQATNRRAVARWLGVHRHPVQRWLDQYAAGGLAALLRRGSAPGRQASLSVQQVEQLRAALARREGFASYGAIRDWIAAELGVAMQYEAVRKVVRYRLGAKLKRARPRPLKKRVAHASLSCHVRHAMAHLTVSNAATLQVVGHG